MSCNDHEKMNPVVHALYHVKEWDKAMAMVVEMVAVVLVKQI